MDKKLKNDLINLLKIIRNKKMTENIKLININDNKDLIIKGVMFDTGHTCYHTYEKIEDVITGLIVSATNYGIYYKDEFIGIISVFYHYYKDLTRLELSMSIKEGYRSKGIGKVCYDYILNKYFKSEGVKSIHLSIREDNIKSRMLAEKCGFKLYKGYKCDNTFINKNGNRISQVQYLLKKKDYVNYIH